MTKDEMWEYLESKNIATYDEIVLVTDINGYTEETLLDILYARTGYRNFEQMKDEEQVMILLFIVYGLGSLIEFCGPITVIGIGLYALSKIGR